ncbi:hypothetical protein PENSPDRAFT_588943 [Peniophora sp. CONT]|nr:hypothetical protein PENSPDRAFT_588943 [Peniophora sp. CONT]
MSLASKVASGSRITLEKALQSVLGSKPPASLSDKSGNLYQVLSRQPRDGVGATVFQTRWTGKDIVGSHWEVSRVRIKGHGEHGKAWGYLTWKGKRVSEHEEFIRGGLKYTWARGVSGPKPKAVKHTITPIAPLPESAAQAAEAAA